MAKIAGERALADACISFSEIQQVCVGYWYVPRSLLRDQQVTLSLLIRTLQLR